MAQSFLYLLHQIPRYRYDSDDDVENGLCPDELNDLVFVERTILLSLTYCRTDLCDLDHDLGSLKSKVELFASRLELVTERDQSPFHP